MAEVSLGPGFYGPSEYDAMVRRIAKKRRREKRLREAQEARDAAFLHRASPDVEDQARVNEVAEKIRGALRRVLQARGRVTVEAAYLDLDLRDWRDTDPTVIAGRCLRELRDESGLVRVDVTNATRAGRHANMIAVWGYPPQATQEGR